MYNGGGLSALRQIISENGYEELYTVGSSTCSSFALEYGYLLDCKGILVFSPVTFDPDIIRKLEPSLQFSTVIPIVSERMNYNQADNFFYDLRPLIRARGDIPLAIHYGQHCDFDNQFLNELKDLNHVNFNGVAFASHASLSYRVRNNQFHKAMSELINVEVNC